MNIIKKMFWVLYCVSIFALGMYKTDVYSMGAASRPQLPAGFDPGKEPSPEEMEAFFQELLSNMDPETIERLNKLGEEINRRAEEAGVNPIEYAEKIGKEAEKLGVDPFEYVFEHDKKQPEPTVTVDKSPAAAPLKKDEKQTESRQLDLTRIGQMKFVLDSLIDKLTTIKHKTAADQRARDMMLEIRYALEDLLSYFYTIRTEQMLTYVIDKEFENLYQALMMFENELSYLEPRLELADFSLEGTISPYSLLRVNRSSSPHAIKQAYENALKTKKAGTPEYKELVEAYQAIVKQEEALAVVAHVIDSIAQTAYKRNVIEDIKKLLKKHEPEALKKKEEQEKLEAKARQEQEEAGRRRPPFSIPAFDIPTPTREARGKSDIFGAFPAGASGGNGMPSTRLSDSLEEKGMATPSSKKENGSKSGAGSMRKGEKAPEKATEPSDVKETTKKKEEGKEKSAPYKKKLEEVEKQLKDLSGFLNMPIGSDDTSVTPLDLLKSIKEYLARPFASAGSPMITDEAKKELKITPLITKSLMEIVTKLSAIKKELFVALNLTPDERIMIRADVKRLFEWYQKNYFKDLAELFSYTLLNDDHTMVITRSGAQRTLHPQKAYVLTATGMDEDELSAPENAPIKELNSKGENYLGKFLDALNDFNTFVNRRG